MHHPYGQWCFFFQAEDGIRDVAVTGVQTCALPISERHERMDLATLPHLGPAFDHDMRIDSGPAADADVLADHGVGAHAHIVGQLGLGVHDGGLMHLGAHGSASGAVVPSVTIAINSASQTRLSST